MDLFINRIERWYLKFRPYFFRYTKGFYEFALLVNSPEVIIGGFQKLHFTKYKKERNLLVVDNAFINSELIHLELERDLILFLSRSVFKKNIKFKFLYDNHIPTDHYFLRYQVTSSEAGTRSALSNGIPYSINTWLFYKPGCSPNNYYFRNTSGMFFTIYFTKRWLKEFLDKCHPERRKGIDHFLNSSQQYLMYPDESKNIDYRLFQNAIVEKPAMDQLNILDFKEATYQVLTDFLHCLNEGSVTAHFFELSNNDRLKIMMAEKYLRSYLNKDFPGLEKIADKIGIAQTALKDGFRVIYGKPVYKYYQAEKMQIAAGRLDKNPRLKIAQLAQEMGYENPGKFSAAFKENIGLTPSDYISKRTGVEY